MLDGSASIADLNCFHLWVGIVALILVVIITIFAFLKKLENEKYWIALVAFIAFGSYCIIDYDVKKAKFRHPASEVRCCYQSSPDSNKDGEK